MRPRKYATGEASRALPGAISRQGVKMLCGPARSRIGWKLLGNLSLSSL